MAATSRVDAILPTAEPIRPLANFPPSIWGDRFLSFSLDTLQLEAYIKAMEEPIEQLKELLSSPTIDSNEKINLIYSMYHLGMTYLFSKEIEGQLGKLFNKLNLKDYDEADLYTISIHFQVFRNFGYKFPCDVFNKFKDCNAGEFKEEIATDVTGMISFYESAQLRIRGESILDEAIAFTETNLKTLEKTLQGTLAQRVKRVLDRPFYRGHQMVEARLYFLNYEEEISRYEMLPKLGKVYFNYLQLLQKEELQTVSKWWKELSCRMKTFYVRDRVPECYIWVSALFLEPYYSYARIITTKVVLFVLFLDDTYDAYATIEENRLLTQAILRWDISAISELPEYIQPFYEILLNEYTQFNKQLGPKGAANVIDASKRAYQDLATAYLQEAEWRHNGVVPSYEEYMKIGSVTSTYDLTLKSALIGMGDIVTQDALAWYESHPKMIIATEMIRRLEDDIVSVKFERERAPTATSVDAYMKSFGVLENVAIEALKEDVENAWKDINEACLKPTKVPMDLLATIVNLTRMNNVAYKYNDAFTFPENALKEYISLLFCVSVPM